MSPRIVAKIIVVALVALFPRIDVSAIDAPEAIDVMTFNILTDQTVTEKWAPWEDRRAGAIDVIDTYDPDLLGLQEASVAQLGDVHDGTETTYRHAWTRTPSGRLNVILYRASRFELLDSGSYTVAPRSAAVWVELQDRLTGATLTATVTHFPAHGDRRRERLRAAEVVLGHYPETPAILMGDFNDDLRGPVGDALGDYGVVAPADNTATHVTGRQYDWILGSEDVTVVTTDVIDSGRSSDHHAVTASVKINSRA